MALSRYVVARLTEAVGEENATTDPLDLRAYEYDAALARATPEIVLFPTTTAAVVDVVRFCNEKDIAVTARGSGTSLSGGPVPLRGGVILGFSRMDQLLEIDIVSQRAVVQPGCLNFDFIQALAEYGHLYAPDPASQRVCTMGGNVAENSGGPHCLKYGVTTNHVTGLKVVLADGEVVELGGKTIENPGYDLRGLMIGSEGTLGIVTEITCRIMPLPESIVTMLAIFDSLITAGEAVSGIIASGMIPATLEMMDRAIIRAVEEAVHAGYPLDAEAVLIIELDGMAAGMHDQVRQVTEVCKERGAIRFEVAQSEEQRELLWEGRKGAFGAVARIAPNKIVTDIAVPRNKLPGVLAEVMEIGKRHGLDIGNVFHAGDGNLHPQLLFDDRDADQVRRVEAADKEIAKLAIEVGGVLTGEHGIGCQKVCAMTMACAPQDLAAMRAIKHIFDPKEILNPDKILPEPDERELNLAPHALDGELPGGGEFSVESYEEAAAALTEATRQKRSVAPVGGRTKIGDLSGALAIDVRKLGSVVDYDWENLTVTVHAGSTIAALQDTLAEHGQFCPVTAPFADRATVGGVIAANSSGPMRYGYGELRDILLGVKFATATGQVLNSGSKTVKDVCGYDIKRLLVGSFGSLGVIVEATMRTLPLTPAEKALIARVDGLEQAERIAYDVRTSQLLPSAIELVNEALWNLVADGIDQPQGDGGDWRLLFSARGYAGDVELMGTGLTRIINEHGGELLTVLERDAAGELWRHVSEPTRLVDWPHYALRLVVLPGRTQHPLQGALSHIPHAPEELEPLVRASLGTGVVQLLIPDAGDDRELWRAYALKLHKDAAKQGGRLGADAPAGLAADIVSRGEPDRISAAIKAEFDPAGVLPPVPC